MKKYRYVKLPPELMDGEHWAPTCNSCDIGDAAIRWLINNPIGSKITLEIIELTDEEVQDLPSI